MQYTKQFSCFAAKMSGISNYLAIKTFAKTARRRGISAKEKSDKER